MSWRRNMYCDFCGREIFVPDKAFHVTSPESWNAGPQYDSEFPIPHLQDFCDVYCLRQWMDTLPPILRPQRAAEESK